MDLTKAEINVLSKMTAKSKTPKGLANEIKRQMVKLFYLNEDYVYVWSPAEAKERGWGDAWCVCAEGAPYDWTILLTGYNKNVYNHKTILCEPYNSFILTFRKI